MASLTHVCMWSKHEWKKITAVEATKLHPNGTVSAHSGLFMCELCGQYVILTDGEKRTRYFKHSAYETNKDCPERTSGYSPNTTYNARAYELPIRLCNITDNQFDLELGLLYVPQSILQRQEVQQVIIQCLGNVTSRYVYAFERLKSETITYVPIDNIPALKYEINSADELKNFWPNYVKGIDSNGNIFDKETGKKLTEDADVLVNKSYYLLCTKKLCQKYRNINIQKLCEKSVTSCVWYIYEVKATAYSEEIARFFWNLHCRLTEFPVRLQPIWPLYVETPYAIRYNRSQLSMHLRGRSDVTAKVFPAISIKRFICPNGNGQIISVDCLERHQLISVGRTNILQYTYLWKDKLDETVPKPDVEVTDANDKKVNPGIQNEVPEHQLLSIVSPFDGVVIILKNAVVIEKQYLIAERRTVIDDIHLGIEIKILQGLDLVWNVRYERKQKELSTDDDTILKKLKAYNGRPIQISHSICAGVKLIKYPKVKKWLYKKIRAGYMPEDAFRYFQHFVVKLKIKE